MEHHTGGDSAAAHIHATAHVDESATIGARTRIWHGAHIRAGARVGTDCVVGKDAYLGPDTTIGDRVKIQNGCGLFGATIADEVMIAPGVFILEDACPRAVTASGTPKTRTDWTADPVHVGRGATIGAGSVIAPGVTIGPYAFVTVASAVTRDVPPHGLVAGNPARLVGWVCRCGQRLRDDLRCAHCGTAHTALHNGLAAIPQGPPHVPDRPTRRRS